MNIEDALQSFGVRDDTLSGEEKRRLDEDGFLLLSNMLSDVQVRAFANRLDELLEAEGDRAGIEVHQEEGTARLANLVDKDPMFETCFTHPRLLAAMVHVLGTKLRLNSLNSRAALPNAGLQGLHSDWGSPVAPGDYYICNSGWLLDDFTAENGATRVVPGSHRSEKRPQDVLEDAVATQPDEIQVFAPAGSVLVFNSHLWHGGAMNKTESPRRVIHSAFCRRDQVPQTNQQEYLSAETRDRLSGGAKCVLAIL
ncbi:MAG: phytanoyl-CoA dioxygenase family protein [Candidatus Poribacteria bacterium]|nr:phytanoyl-CoA dioxygenase family protein [Candidatus Poribacteria bacterium]